jgi:hypothetical protein
MRSDDSNMKNQVLYLERSTTCILERFKLSFQIYFGNCSPSRSSYKSIKECSRTIQVLQITTQTDNSMFVILLLALSVTASTALRVDVWRDSSTCNDTAVRCECNCCSDSTGKDCFLMGDYGEESAATCTPLSCSLAQLHLLNSVCATTIFSTAKVGRKLSFTGGKNECFFFDQQPVTNIFGSCHVTSTIYTVFFFRWKF